MERSIGKQPLSETTHEIFCPDCGYDLRSIGSDRCPECGAAIDRSGMGVSRLPWARRAEIGSLRAYLQTLWMVVAHPRELAGEVARPVRLIDAKRFRMVTLFIALLAPAQITALLYGDRAASPAPWPVLPDLGMMMSSTPPGTNVGAVPHRTLGRMLEMGIVPAVWLGCWLFLCSASVAASVFFHPSSIALERQNRAVAISYYACAPWVLTPLSVLSMTAWLTAVRGGGFRTGARVWLFAAAIVPATQVVATYVAPMAMLRRATSCGEGRLIVAALALPIVWAILAAVFLVLVPAAYAFMALMVMSLAA